MRHEIGATVAVRDGDQDWLAHQLGSCGIAAEMFRVGATSATLLDHNTEDGDARIEVWRINLPDATSFRAANTNADPIWEEQDGQAFADLLAEPGFSID
jgi:hypothetical protein